MLLSSACARVGTELTPAVRAEVQGFVVALHTDGEDSYQVVVWHPQGHFYAFCESAAPFQAKLLGDAMRPSTASSESFTFTERTTTHVTPLQTLLGGGSHTTVRTEQARRTARTCWSFDRGRWKERRPFRLAFIRGWEPLIPEKRMEIEITLGPEVGSAEGLTARLVSQDPFPAHTLAATAGNRAHLAQEVERISEDMPVDVWRYIQLRIQGTRPVRSTRQSSRPLKTQKGPAQAAKGKEAVAEEGARLRAHYAGETAVIAALDEADRLGVEIYGPVGR